MMTVRQLLSILSSQKEELEANDLTSFVSRYEEPIINLDSKTVSYTHLTLPTS